MHEGNKSTLSSKMITTNDIQVNFFETIPRPVASKTAVLAISICMNGDGSYYSPEAFAAITEMLVQKEFEKIEVLLPGELEGYSIAMEQGKPDIDESIKQQARKATADWVKANILSLAKIIDYNRAKQKSTDQTSAQAEIKQWLKVYKNSTEEFPAINLHTYEQIIATPEYAIAKQLISYAMNEASNKKYFNNEIEKDAVSYRKRRAEKSNYPNASKNYVAQSSEKLAITYRHVELAGFLYFTLNQQIKAGAFLYPSKPATSFKALDRVIIKSLVDKGILIKHNSENQELISLPYPLTWCGLKIKSPTLDKNKKQRQTSLPSSSSNPALTLAIKTTSPSSREGSPRSSLDARRGSNPHALTKIKLNQPATHAIIGEILEDPLSPNSLTKEVVSLRQQLKEVEPLKQQVKELTELVCSQQKYNTYKQEELNPIGNYSLQVDSCWNLLAKFPHYLYVLYDILISKCYCPTKNKKEKTVGYFNIFTSSPSSSNGAYIAAVKKHEADSMEEQDDSTYKLP